MTVSGERYPYMTAAWDSPLSFGMQALIEYNGYVINDRYQSDRVHVTSITGLDDPDITDSREPAPGTDGEFPYQALYRGRTIVISGTIEAGSLGTCKQMERDLKAAYAPLVESPMTWRWFDIYDSFDDLKTVFNYTALSGALSTLQVRSSTLRFPGAGTWLLARSSENRLYGDSQLTVRAVVGSTTTGTSVQLVPKVRDSSDYIVCSYQTGSTPTLQIASVTTGTPNVLATTNVVSALQPQVGQQIWVRARLEGDLVTCELWLAPPTETTLPALSVTAWLTGADADTFGDQVLGQVGLGATTVDANWALDDFHVQSLMPGDVSFMARKLSPISIKEAQGSLTRFKRDFQITMRASNFRAMTAQTRSLTLIPTSNTSTALGRVYPRTYPRTYHRFLTSSLASISNLIFVQNRGTVAMLPIIRFYGAVSGSGLSLVNLTNGNQIFWLGALTDGDYLQFDCQQRTVVNSTGADQRKFLVPVPQWISLEPGWNDLLVGGGGYSANTKVVVFSRNAYL